MGLKLHQRNYSTYILWSSCCIHDLNKGISVSDSISFQDISGSIKHTFHQFIMVTRISSWKQLEMKTSEHWRPSRKSRFSTWRPWPLTYDLDLRTHPRYYQGQCICLGLFWVCTSNGSAVRAFTDTYTHTGRTNSIPSTADAEGKKPAWNL